jgi:hypothetical protein
MRQITQRIIRNSCLAKNIFKLRSIYSQTQIEGHHTIRKENTGRNSADFTVPNAEINRLSGMPNIIKNEAEQDAVLEEQE